MKDPDTLFQPIAGLKLKSFFVEQCSQLILSGELEIGSKLPSERELALKMGVSRPVVHEGLLDLQNMGLITLKSRFGATVNDYRKYGSLDLLNALLQYQQGDLKPELLDNLLDMREHIETEIARLAARHRSTSDLQELEKIVQAEKSTASQQVARLVELDFEFHLRLSLACGNQVYALLLNSFQPVYTTFTAIFYQNPAVCEPVQGFHAQLLEAVRGQDADLARQIMGQVIEHGRQNI